MFRRILPIAIRTFPNIIKVGVFSFSFMMLNYHTKLNDSIKCISQPLFEHNNSRKFLPTDWYNFHNSKNITNNADVKPTNEIEKGDYHKPSCWKQIGVYIMRDINSKLNNTQYILINFLEAPVLAFILAYFLRYSKNNGAYIFSENVNLPAYIFMCVIVALFMGLTSSAEEIIRDRKILKREKFLNPATLVICFLKRPLCFSFRLYKRQLL